MWDMEQKWRKHFQFFLLECPNEKQFILHMPYQEGRTKCFRHFAHTSFTSSFLSFNQNRTKGLENMKFTSTKYHEVRHSVKKFTYVPLIFCFCFVSGRRDCGNYHVSPRKTKCVDGSHAQWSALKWNCVVLRSEVNMCCSLWFISFLEIIELLDDTSKKAHIR